MRQILLTAGLCAFLSGAPARRLEIQRAGLHQLEDGPQMGLDHYFVPGETVYFSCLVDGYQVSEKKRTLITYRIEAVDPQGVPLMEEVRSKVDEELRDEDKEWKPKIRREMMVPLFAPSGTYTVRIAAKDEVGGATAVKETAFAVRGHPVRPSEKLTVDNFGYYRSEDETKPLQIAAYRPGETVWAKFDLTGYKFGPGNALDVSYAISVSASDGRVLFRQAEPTAEKDASFYPKRYVPCVINLNLQKNIAPGEYSVKIEARDAIGDQQFEWNAPFRVE